jgi:histidine triad (HIT) family protein
MTAMRLDTFRMKEVTRLDSCIFCLIGSKKIPSQIVYEDDQILAFHDLNSQAPVHVLVIPKRHIASVGTGKPGDEPLFGHLLLKAATVAELTGIADTGYRVVANTGPQAGQSVSHLHLHVLGGRILTWPPG